MGSVVDTVLYGMFLLVSMGGPGAEWSARWPRGPSLFAGAQLVPYRTSNDRYLDPCKASKYRKTLKSTLTPPPTPLFPLPTPLFLCPCYVTRAWPYRGLQHRCQITVQKLWSGCVHCLVTLSLTINETLTHNYMPRYCFNTKYPDAKSLPLLANGGL